MRKELKILGILAFSLTSQMVFAQINGKVQESDGEPSIGAKVEIKGTGTFTRANDDGEFELSEAKVGDVLVITNLDEQTQEVKATNNLVFKFIKDTKKEKEIEGVTVIGTIKINPQEQIGSSATIKADALSSIPVSSVNEALEGTVGLNFSGGGSPGAITNITIRGTNTFAGSSNPLYVIDGVPIGKGEDNSNLLKGYASFSPLANLDPNSIESITVLKDVAGTSLYGSQGANGVILIKTKSGKYNQKTKFSFTTEIGYQEVSFDKHDWMSSEEYIKWVGLTYAGADYVKGVTNAYDNLSNYQAKAKANLKWDGVTNTDWKKAVQRNSSVVSQYSFNATGGGENTSFNLGASYYKNDPLIKFTNFDRLSFNVGLNHKASEKISLNFNGNVSHSKIKTNATGGTYSNPWGSGWQILPIYPVYNADGSYNTGNLGGNSGFNTLELLESDFLKGQYTTFLGSIGMDYRFIKDFKFNSSFAPQYQVISEQSWWNQYTGTGANYNGLLQDSQTKIFDYAWTNFVQYQKKFAEKHNVTIDVGADYQEHTKRYMNAVAENFPGYAFTELSFGKPLSADGYKKKWTQMSYIGRASYNYDNLFTLTANFRRDGNSTFSDNNKWGNFWNGGLLFNISNLSFLQGNKIISDLKIRGNYGTAGNTPMVNWDRIDLYKPIFDITSYSDSNEPSLVIGSPGNTDLKWETSKQLNLGVDFGLFNNRIRGTFDYYNRKTEDLISIVTLPYTEGGPNATYENIGAIRNSGIELGLSASPIKNEHFYWNTSLSGSYNKSKVLKLASTATGISLNAYGKALQVGNQVGEYYMLEWAGVNAATGAGSWYANNSNLEATYNGYTQAQKDNLKNTLYYDDSGKLVTTTSGEALRKFTGDTNMPIWGLAFSNEIGYKGFKLSFTFTGSFDYKVFESYNNYIMSDGQYSGSMNQIDDMLYDSWTPSNPNASNPIQRAPNPTNSNYQYSTRFLYKGDHIRLKEAKISYTFNKEFLGENLGIEGITVYVRGTNLFVWAFDKDLRFDPDSYSNTPANNTTTFYPDFYGKGMYNFTSPVMRIYSFGINVNF